MNKDWEEVKTDMAEHLSVAATPGEKVKSAALK